MNLEAELRSEYGNKKVLVVGLGLLGGGAGVAKFFANLGSKVSVTDKKSDLQLKPSIEMLKDFNIHFTLGRHDLKDFLEADVIFKGPFVPWDLPEILEARKHNIPIEMEMSFFAGKCPAKIIGITGTRGKSTTTEMIYSLLKKARIPCYLAGNIPHVSTIQLLPIVKANEYVVMELASWPLSGFHHKKISPQISVFTNLYPDHLNYYKNMDDYFFDKSAIFSYQKSNDLLICNISLKERVLKFQPKSRLKYFSENDFPHDLLYLKGKHNSENASAAYLVGKELGLNEVLLTSVLSDFKPIPYRQEIILESNGLIFINDTTSTTPTATIKAIESFTEYPIVLILGGMDKNLPPEDLITKLKDVSSIVLLKGTFTDKIYPRLQKHYAGKITGVYDSLDQVVLKAIEIGKNILKGHHQDKVFILFSPGATSFAMFNNEFHRGDTFNRIVKQFTREL